MKNIVVGILLMCITLSFVNAHEKHDKQKVVYHVNFADKQRQVMTTKYITNHINAVGGHKNIEIVVVFHGAGLSMLLEPDALSNTKMKKANADASMQASIAGLKDKGVKFKICANTLKGKKITFDEDLYDVDQEDIVPSGVAEISRLQHLGFTYIKP